MSGRHQIFESSFEFDQQDLARRIEKPINEQIAYFNRMAPRKFRAALRETFAQDPDLKNYGKIVDGMKVENRKFGQAKVGSGMSFNMQNNKLVVRIQLTDKKFQKLLGRDGWWKLKTLTEGKYTIKLEANKPQPYRVSLSDPRSTGRYDEGLSRRKYDSEVDAEPSRKGVAFNYSTTGGVKTGTTRKIMWIEKAQQLAIEKLTKLINKRR